MGKLSKSLLISSLSLGCVLAVVACQHKHDGRTNESSSAQLSEADAKLLAAVRADRETKASLGESGSAVTAAPPAPAAGAAAPSTAAHVNLANLENRLIAAASTLKAQASIVRVAKAAVDKLQPDAVVPKLDASLIQAATKKPAAPLDPAKVDAMRAEYETRQKALTEAIKKFEANVAALQAQIEQAQNSLKLPIDAAFSKLDPAVNYPFLFILVGADTRDRINDARTQVKLAVSKQKKYTDYEEHDLSGGFAIGGGATTFDRYIVHANLNEVKTLRDKVAAISTKLMVVIRPIQKVVVKTKVVIQMQDGEEATFSIGTVANNGTLDQLNLDQPYTYLFDNNKLTCKEVDGECIKELNKVGALNAEVETSSDLAGTDGRDAQGLKKIKALDFLRKVLDRSIEALAKIPESAPGFDAFNDREARGVYRVAGKKFDFRNIVSDDFSKDTLDNIRLEYEVAVQDSRAEYGEMPVITFEKGLTVTKEALTYTLPIEAVDASMKQVAKLSEAKKLLNDIKKALE